MVIALVIHIPERDLGESGEDGAAQPEKRTRRGSRGGRNRKKKTAATVGAPVVEETSENGASEPTEEWTYTPMSEWEMDES